MENVAMSLGLCGRIQDDQRQDYSLNVSGQGRLFPRSASRAHGEGVLLAACGIAALVAQKNQVGTASHVEFRE